MFSTDIDLTRWILASGALIVLLFIFAYAVRYVANKQPQAAFGMKRKRLKLVETLHLDARNKICIVEFDDTEVILSVGTNGSETIGTQDKAGVSEDDICEQNRIEGIGFLKRFIKGACAEEKIKDLSPKKSKKAKK